MQKCLEQHLHAQLRIIVNSVLFKRYDEVTAKAAYLEMIKETAKSHDLSEDIGPYTIRLSIVFTVIAVFFVGVRFFCRWKFSHRYGWDDWLILASVIMLTGNMAMNIIGGCRKLALVPFVGLH